MGALIIIIYVITELIVHLSCITAFARELRREVKRKLMSFAKQWLLRMGGKNHI